MFKNNIAKHQEDLVCVLPATCVFRINREKRRGICFLTFECGEIQKVIVHSTQFHTNPFLHVVELVTPTPPHTPPPPTPAYHMVNLKVICKRNRALHTQHHNSFEIVYRCHVWASAKRWGIRTTECCCRGLARRKTIVRLCGWRMKLLMALLQPAPTWHLIQLAAPRCQILGTPHATKGTGSNRNANGHESAFKSQRP